MPPGGPSGALRGLASQREFYHSSTDYRLLRLKHICSKPMFGLPIRDTQEDFGLGMSTDMIMTTPRSNPASQIRFRDNICCQEIRLSTAISRWETGPRSQNWVGESARARATIHASFSGIKRYSCSHPGSPEKKAPYCMKKLRYLLFIDDIVAFD